MIFTPPLWQEIVVGNKTETRRLVRPTEELRSMLVAGVEYPLAYVYDVKSERIKWMVGRRYSVQPGRGKPSLARIELKGIRGQMLQSITQAEAKAEGVVGAVPWAIEEGLPDPTVMFSKLWNSLHRQRGARWEDNPHVWVLTFRYLGPS